MHALLIANTLFEGVIGLFMVFMPDALFQEANPLALSYARTFGFAALAISMLSLIIYASPKRREILLSGYTTLALFHSGLTLAQAINFFQGFSSFFMILMHGLFTVLFVASAFHLLRKHR